MRTTLAGIAMACCLGGPAVAAAQTSTTPAPAPQAPARIAEGVSCAGVALDGLTLKEAARTLRLRAQPKAQRRLVVRIGGRSHVLPTRRVRLLFDERRTARRALTAGRRARGRPVTVTPSITFRPGALSAFVRGVTRASSRAPRNASIRITIRRIVGRRATYGRRIDASRLDKALRRRIRDPLATRGITPRLRRVRPAVRLIELRRRNATIVTVDRGGHRLRLFKRLRYDRSYPIAVGAAGFETPTGIRHVLSRQVNPSWTAPNRPWAGSYAGRTVPGGAPDNPLRARFIDLGNGIGIHGTAESFSIGRSASHGCIRMHVSDVIDLFPRVPLGAAVLIR